jgi:hypothetical protein
MASSADALDLTNLLCGLAWLGELNREQIQHLWFPHLGISTIEKTLSRLRKDKLIAVRLWSVRDTERNVTVPRLATWSLTPAGHRQLRACSEYPERPMHPRQARLREHDARITETIVRLIEIARPYGLRGIFVRHEVQLDPRRPRPTCDALVILHLGDGDAPNRVPWSHDRHSDMERSFSFAVESDNATETPEMLRWKGSSYARLDTDVDSLRRWREQYGEPPIPIWVAPTAARAQQIHACWRSVWPSGMWLIGDDTGLADNRWLLWQEQCDRTTSIKFPDHRVLPSASKAAPSSVNDARDVRRDEPALSPPASQPQLIDATQTDRLRAPPEDAIYAPVPLAPATPSLEELIRNAIAGAAPAPLVSSDDTTLGAMIDADVPLAAPIMSLSPSPSSMPARKDLSVSAVPAVTPARDAMKLMRTSGALAWFILMLPLRVIVAIYRAVSGVLTFVADVWGYEARNALVVGICVVALAVGGWAAFGSYLGELAARVAEDWRQATTAASPVVAPSPTAATAPGAHDCGSGRVSVAGVRLRRAPSLTGQTVRVLARFERVTLLCDRQVEADGYVWQRVIGARDAAPGWMAVNWLEQ